MPDRAITFAEAIREATDQAMEADDRVFIIGEGVPDPKGIFGTTLGLKEKYGKGRVMDMPVSENAVTGICIGAAISGMRPIMTHQRVDFSLYSLDQIINNAAKWRFMFGDKQSVPLVIRMVIGRGWGQGAQHSQNLQALFAHIPGLKVVMPATAYDAKGLFMASLAEDNPVIFLEHRWTHILVGNVPLAPYTVSLGKARVAHAGDDITIVSSSYMTIESLRAANVLLGEGVGVDLIDLRTIRPFDEETVLSSLRKTGHLLVVDSGWETGGVAGEVMARVTEKGFDLLKAAPQRVTLPDMPTPSSPALTKDYYPTYVDIVQAAMNILDKNFDNLMAGWARDKADNTKMHDVPDPSFMGPF